MSIYSFYILIKMVFFPIIDLTINIQYLDSYKFLQPHQQTHMTRSSKSNQKKDEAPSRKKLIQQSKQDTKKRTKSNIKNDPQPQKKIKKTTSVDMKASKNSKSDPSPKKDDLKKSDKKQTTKQSTKADQEKKQVKILLKGSIPVDSYVKNKNVKVLVHNGITFAATLNQSNIQNNNNKFYIIQVLESETNSNNFYFFTRWGRVGVTGQMAQAGPMTRDAAIKNYNSKLADKTRSGQYRKVQMNYESKDEEVKPELQKVKPDKQIKSTLDPKVQDLLRLIFDMKMMNNQMKQIGYDAKKMPLGKLAKASIMKGYEALKKLMEQVKGKKRKDILAQHSSDFYSQIPHDFGFNKMSNYVLDTEPKIRAKLQMLQSLEDIQIFTKLLDQGKIASDMNELDSNYLKLNTEIAPLNRQSKQFEVIQKYVQNTHASTHTAYKLKIQQVYTLNKQVQSARYTKDIDNKMLLWHGSRLTNYVGILSQGLRIAPPQAPVTGYMFGKGVYFADMVTKSANYCFTNRTNTTGIMLLCEVALGDMNQKFYADYYANLLPDGKKSTKGVGKTEPKTGQKLGDVYVPNGKGQPSNVANSSLLYNQFIVYDVAQIKCKYLLRMNFIYP